MFNNTPEKFDKLFLRLLNSNLNINHSQEFLTDYNFEKIVKLIAETYKRNNYLSSNLNYTHKLELINFILTLIYKLKTKYQYKISYFLIQSFFCAYTLQSILDYKEKLQEEYIDLDFTALDNFLPYIENNSFRKNDKVLSLNQDVLVFFNSIKTILMHMDLIERIDVEIFNENWFDFYNHERGFILNKNFFYNTITLKVLYMYIDNEYTLFYKLYRLENKNIIFIKDIIKKYLSDDLITMERESYQKLSIELIKDFSNIRDGSVFLKKIEADLKEFHVL